MVYSIQEGRTALCLASWRGHADIVRLLIKGGADVNICAQVRVVALLELGCYNSFCDNL